MEVSGQLYASADLPPGKNIDKHFMGSWSGRFGERENFCSSREKNFKFGNDTNNIKNS
jgi:hypothetical protein